MHADHFVPAGSVLHITRFNIIHATLRESGLLHLPEKLLRSADIYPGDEFWVWNISAGRRFRCCTGSDWAGDVMLLPDAGHEAIGAGHVLIVYSAPKTDRLKLSSKEPLAVFVDPDRVRRSVPHRRDCRRR